MTLVGAVMLLIPAETVDAQKVANMYRWHVNAGRIETIRIYRHPSFSPGHMVLEIFPKNPNDPAFVVHGEDGQHLESLVYLNELAREFKKGLVVLYQGSQYTVETNSPYFGGKPYSKKMHTVLGFYPPGFPGGGGPPPAGGQTGTSEMIPAQPLELLPDGQQHRGQPEGEPMRERMTDDAPPPEHPGFCCVHREVIEVPAHVCQMEGGAFFRDPESAHMRCQPGGR